MIQKKPATILMLSWVISILIILTALVGIFGSETYISETNSWKLQSIGQDKINLIMMVPVLLLSGFKVYQQKSNYLFIFGGSLLFLIYTFIIYCFTVHFNSLFIVYCALLGLSFYSFIYVFIQSYRKCKNQLAVLRLPVKTLRSFLWITALLFYFLWLRAFFLGCHPCS